MISYGLTLAYTISRHYLKRVGNRFADTLQLGGL